MCPEIEFYRPFLRAEHRPEDGRADFHVGRVCSRETAKVELGPPAAGTPARSPDRSPNFIGRDALPRVRGRGGPRPSLPLRGRAARATNRIEAIPKRYLE